MSGDSLNVWLYFFSTIPQAFAAIFGALLAVGLFRMQSVDSREKQLVSNFSDFFNRAQRVTEYREKFYSYIASENYDGLVKKIDECPIDDVSLLNDARNLAELKIQRITLSKEICSSFKFAIFMVLLTIILIPLGRYIEACSLNIWWGAFSVYSGVATFKVARLFNVIMGK